MNNSQRVIVNTMFLYANMIVNICVQLIAVRLILSALGKIDYGIYNVIAGVVALFAFMNAAMAAATQRYLSYEIGKGGDVKEVFYMSLILHLIIGIVVVAALEVGGIYYVNHILSAPEERLSAARVLLHCITASTFVNIITVPYEADINANENMGAIALINILDSLMKLGTAIFIGHTSHDRLIIFGALTMTTLITTLVIKRIYCLSHYEESHIKWHKITDYRKMKAMASFASWNFIGAGCSVGRYQGTAMILNYFFGIVINTAYGIAQQVNGLVNFLSITIVRAIRPQIVKSAGAGDMARVHKLSATTCKITSLMVALIAIPLYIEMPFVLGIWLGDNVNINTIMFCKCFLVIVFTNQLTAGLQIAIESVGKIRMLQTILGSMHLLALPLGYLCFTFGMPAISIMLCVILEETLGIFARTIIANRLCGISRTLILMKNVLPCVCLVILTWTATSAIIMEIHNPWIHFVCTVIASTLLLCSITYYILLTKDERKAINGFLGRIKALH